MTFLVVRRHQVWRLKRFVKFPVDLAQRTHARVIVKSYEPAAHFTRSLTITDLRPTDWFTDERVPGVQSR